MNFRRRRLTRPTEGPSPLGSDTGPTDAGAQPGPRPGAAGAFPAEPDVWFAPMPRQDSDYVISLYEEEFQRAHPPTMDFPPGYFVRPAQTNLSWLVPDLTAMPRSEWRPIIRDLLERQRSASAEPMATERYPGVPRIPDHETWLYEGDAGMLLDVWLDDRYGTPVVFGLWVNGVGRRILFLGRGPRELARILADVGPLPIKNWVYREPYFPWPDHVGPWPPMRG